MSIVTVTELAQQLEIVNPDVAEQARLQRLIDAAEAYTETWLPQALSAYDPLPADLKHAVVMLAASFYENREALSVGQSTTVVPQQLPFGWADIIRGYRAWSFG